jgi:xanthine dehydrogenase accessory factor
MSATRQEPIAPDIGGWLTPLTGHWIDSARVLLSTNAAVVRVMVVGLKGSAPREPGASMLIDATGTVGTIGGGRLEWHAITAARELLRDAGAQPVRITDLTLGTQLGQCCGGRVELWLERLTRDDASWLSEASRRMRERGGVAVTTEVAAGVVSRRLQRALSGAHPPALQRNARQHILFEIANLERAPLTLFGAGHVGQALVRLLAELQLYAITWVDARAELLPTGLPPGVTARVCAQPADWVDAAPASTRFVVMTHDHGLDYELCRRILARSDSYWLGLIGSASKAARFRSRLLRDGVERDTVARLICPIGVPGIASKLPAAIAIAIAAQLLQQSDAGLHVSAPAELKDCAAQCRACDTEQPKTP